MIKLLRKLLAHYTERWLSSGAQGFLGFIGIGKESTWGTGVAATDYFEFMSENITQSIDRFPTRNAFNRFAEPDDYAGARRVAGDMSMFGHPLSIGHLLKAAMNTISQTSVLSGFLYRTRFISTTSEFADGVPSQPYTFEIHRDTTSSFRYSGAVCNRLAMALAPNQDLRVTAGWIAQAASVIARTVPTFPGSPTDPFTFDSASISIAGVATARLEAFNLTINNNLDGILALNNANTIARIRRNAPQEVRIGGTLDFIDNAEYDTFVNQTEQALRVNLFRSQSFSLLIDVPRFVYTAFPLGVPGRGRLTVGFEGMARYLASSGVALDMMLTSTKSNY